MYRSVNPNLESVFKILERQEESNGNIDHVFSGCHDSGLFEHEATQDCFPDFVDAEDELTRGSVTVLGVGRYCRPHPGRDLLNVNTAVAGQVPDNRVRVKDSATDYHYICAERQQELDFSNFEAHIHKTSSVRDLVEAGADSVVSMAPVITMTPPTSPSRHSFSWRNLPPDMLGKSGSISPRKHSHSGVSTPSGMMTPTGMQTPSGMRTPTGMPSRSGMKKSSSVANLIHYHTLESVKISELYSHQNTDSLHDSIPNVNAIQTSPNEKDFSKHFGRSLYRSERFLFDKKYQSHSCPHSRHHSPPRQWPRIETVKETEGSLPDIVTASGGSNGNVDFKDINFNDTDDIKIINNVDDMMPARHDVDAAAQHQDGCYCRNKNDSLSFAALFSRCRYERDTSVPNTPCEGDNHVVDPEQLMNRVNDFLCAERVSQMTKTYNDIEAVTHLLEEKERDLELAARIGQTLLSKNKELNSRTETLEEQLSLATDKVNQMRHDLVMKDELLRFYNEDLDQDNSGDITPNEKSAPVVNVDFLEKKVKTLEDENVNLRLESAQLKSETDNYEEKEKRLVEDCIQQLGDVNLQVESLAEELHQKVEENAHHKEEITILLGQIADLQTKIRKLTLENIDIHERLTASTESQRKLTKELGCMHDKYDELFEMLEEAQDELRMLRGKHKVRTSGQHHHSAYSVPTDSLASELETSLQQELSQSKRRSQSWKVFETARAAKRAAAKAVQREASAVTRMSLAGHGMMETDSQAPSAYPSDVESMASDGYSADMDSLYGSNPELGQPGIPGSNDLESALKRLAMRRANEQNERDFLEEEEERRRRKVQAAMSGGTSPLSVRSPVPHALRSPAGSISSAYWGPNGASANNHHYKFSEKLQIVKPMEGSMTLRHWQHLATPHLGGIFEERDGVQMKGEKRLDLVEEIYSLSDFEEDDDAHDVQTRREQEMNLTYTFTDSTISNPGSYRGQNSLFDSRAPMSENMNILARGDQLPGNATEPQHLSEPNVQSGDSAHGTHNRSMGLASLLQGRENTEVGRALMRVSALKSGVTSAGVSPPSSIRGSPPDFNQMVLSSRTFGSHSVGSSTPRGIPGSRSFEQAMQEYEEKRKAYSQSKSAKKPELFAPGMTGKGFLQQLKSKGYSLYGLWGAGVKNSHSGVESSTDGTNSHGDGNTPTTKAATESAFSQGAGVGVLGALTNFRRNGMF